MSAHLKILLIYDKKMEVALFLIICFFVMPAMSSDRFMDHGDGTVTDTKTGLMWATTDNGIPINWQNSLQYCQNYSAGSHTDWRMPTLTELESLYDPGAENKRGYHISNLIETSTQSLWASETRGFEAARFNFAYGQVYWLRQSYFGPTRVLPVRGGN